MSFCNHVALHNLYNLLHVSIERHLEGSFKSVRAKMIKLIAWKRGINAPASSWNAIAEFNNIPASNIVAVQIGNVWSGLHFQWFLKKHFNKFPLPLDC
jgi:hypothetical protein